MNKTRRDWSDVYNCYNDKQTSLAAFYSLSTVIYAIVIGFYFTVYYIETRFPARASSSSEEATSGENIVASTSTPEPEPGPSSSPSSVRSDSQPIKPQKVINVDSDDDEMLIGSVQSTTHNQELKAFDL